MSLDSLRAALADRYAIERELGVGGMATVYLAEDLKHKRKVAIKVLKPELAAVLGAERFVQEITTTAALQHPHILPLFDSGEVRLSRPEQSDPEGSGVEGPASFLYYVMPFIDGETLRDKLNRETQFGIDEAVRITSEVADALDYAHGQGVIHRDIKPENILLANGRPMVADFGIALALSAAAGGRMTETGMSLGTPHYMSPEQATADKEISARSDVYSLGSVLYEMLTGEPPHMGNSAQQIIMKIVAEEAQPVTRLRKSVPPNVAAAVAKSLEKLPADRFESAARFKEALANPGFATERFSAVGGSSPRAGSWLTDRRTMALLAMVVVAIAALGVFASRDQGVVGLVEYDVGLPDGAAMGRSALAGFDIDPAGHFIVYQVERDGRGELWFRSLTDRTSRLIAGTDGGWDPAISPDGNDLAFLRKHDDGWTLETVPIEGGPPTVLGRGTDDTTGLLWLLDGRLVVIEGDGTDARFFDQGGGPTTSRPLGYCIMAAPLPDPSRLLCGGGGDKFARTTGLRDSSSYTDLWRGVPDSTPVFGSHFKVVDDRYLTYVSAGGDLLAASVDLASGRVGNAVRMATGLGRRNYTGAGTYDISRSGTLVYAEGTNDAVGHLVVIGDASTDTLPFGREAFLRFDVRSDGRRVAAVVESLEGEELRIYDVETGGHEVLDRRAEIRQPLWSPEGDRLLWSANDTIFVGYPDRSESPEPVFVGDETLEGFVWTAEDRVVGALWGSRQTGELDLSVRPVTLDTLLSDASFVRTSPDGKWIAYSDGAIASIWLEPFPADGRRYAVSVSGADEAQWLSPTELVFINYSDYGTFVSRVDVDANATPPVRNRRRWLDLPQFRGTAGQSFAITPDDRFLYVEGAVRQPVRFLRVIPDWVDQMKAAVDEANR